MCGRRDIRTIGNLSVVWATVGVETIGVWHRLMKEMGEYCSNANQKMQTRKILMVILYSRSVRMLAMLSSRASRNIAL